MNKLQRTAASAIAGFALLANTALPLYATTTVVIEGNGAGSTNYTQVNQQNETTVQQNNTANVTNTVDVDSDTGKNDANFNTGGDTVVSTGNATTDVDINNVLNSNAASVDCCDQGDTDVTIEGNGALSDNVTTLRQRTETTAAQNNAANVTNDVDVDSDTGKNDANLNTGGDTAVLTGDAHSAVSVSTAANTNTAEVGNDAGDASGLSLRIIGNGAGSENWINANLRKATTVAQTNNANVTNDVDVDSDTGYNDADFNTGGDVLIHTGKAMADVDVANMLNFNHADVDCGCTWNVMAKIAGNGANPLEGENKSFDLQPFEGINTIKLNLGSQQLVGQNNFAGVNNDLEDIDLDTGKNDANSNTGEVDGYSDPAVVTGDAGADVDVYNSLNTNSADDTGYDWDWPWGDMDVDFSFNMSALLAMIGMNWS